ncbi:MAG: hypothetical protein MJ250_03790 [Alphaproteobacteria bacterium]|nr:hypothetical protein [Alphaproteobacteria bacterium]
MPFRKINYPFNNDIYSDKDRFIVPDYKFTCASQITTDSIEVYKVDKNGAIKIFEGKKDSSEFFDFFKRNNVMELSSRGIISAGHSVVHLEDKLSCGKQPLESTMFAMKIMEILQEFFDYKYDYFVLLNDLFVEKDLTRKDLSEPNYYRDQMFNPYIVPSKIAKTITDTAKKLNRAIDYNYCTSCNLADKFRRFIKKQKYESKEFLREKNDNCEFWYYLLDNEKILVLKNNKANCVACNCTMLKDIRFTNTKGKLKDGYKSYIGIFPFCSKANVLNGCKIAYKLYKDFDLKTYIIFFGGTCN